MFHGNERTGQEILKNRSTEFSFLLRSSLAVEMTGSANSDVISRSRTIYGVMVIRLIYRTTHSTMDIHHNTVMCLKKARFKLHNGEVVLVLIYYNP